MIALAAERYPPELHAANNRRVNQEATDELDEDKAQSFVGDREVLGYAVHGPWLVVVSSDDDGFVVKQAFPLDEKKAEKETARLQPPAPEPEDDENEDKTDDEQAEAEQPAAAHEKAEAKGRGGTAQATATATATPKK